MTTTTATVYDELEAACLPLIEVYQDDLLKHDRAALEANEGKPFLHWTHDRGTHITFLLGIGDLPARGVYVKYLFGMADRWHIAREMKSLAEWHANPNNGGDYLVHYFDGKRLKVVTKQQALQIATEHSRRLISQIAQDDLR